MKLQKPPEGEERREKYSEPGRRCHPAYSDREGAWKSATKVCIRDCTWSSYLVLISLWNCRVSAKTGEKDEHIQPLLLPNQSDIKNISDDKPENNKNPRKRKRRGGSKSDPLKDVRREWYAGLRSYENLTFIIITIIFLQVEGELSA